ncbi:MAG: hypothetical protein ICV51_04325 [Flavisolibacter sp.]|nr:hypothetical protein [Flavisolibacter sp.]MBD0295198.1 hypothetical protein [Flavisolibacter sp.]MBD0365685.1 hypothetical protein [Flavisolibacter sp.]MBD0374837.1 hypothetical protein [Flavisolibacter sp.]
MQEQNKQASSDPNANRGHGAQGIDKAPGEETAQDTMNMAQETQKGKKVDRDPSQEQDEPLEQQDV